VTAITNTFGYLKIYSYGCNDDHASEFVTKRWQAHKKKENERVYSYTNRYIAAAIIWIKNNAGFPEKHLIILTYHLKIHCLVKLNPN
jgi:hypothetical protein